MSSHANPLDVAFQPIVCVIVEMTVKMAAMKKIAVSNSAWFILWVWLIRTHFHDGDFEHQQNVSCTIVEFLSPAANRREKKGWFWHLGWCLCMKAFFATLMLIAGTCRVCCVFWYVLWNKVLWWIPLILSVNSPYAFFCLDCLLRGTICFLQWSSKMFVNMLLFRFYLYIEYTAPWVKTVACSGTCKV